MRPIRTHERLLELLDSMFVFVGVFSVDGVLTDANRALLELSGISREEAFGRPFPDTPWWSHSPAAREQIQDALARAAAGETVRADYTVRMGDQLACVDGMLAPLRDASGAIVEIVGVGVDVTERKRTETALRESDQRFRQLTDAIDGVFWLLDVDTFQPVYVSPGFERLTGQPVAPLLGPGGAGAWLAAVHPDDRDRVAQAARTKAARGTFDEEYRIVRPDGEVRWIRDRAFPIHDAGGRVVRIAGVAQDVTDRRALEAQLRHAQKLESVGQLAGGVAHDFNNLLTVIVTSAQYLQARLPAGEERELVGEFLQASARAATLTRQLLAFGRQQVLAPRVIDLNAAIGDARRILRRLIGADVVMTIALSPEIGRVRIDPGSLTQVLMNLAANADDAMPQGGTLTITTADDVVDERAAARTGLPPGRYVRIDVADTGVGMPPEVAARVFEPFFTTKDIGKGTGLGLAVVHGVVEQSGGHIAVASELGVGTTLTIHLPVV